MTSRQDPRGRPAESQAAQAAEPGPSKVYLPDLRELLNQEVPMAAEAIRTLTGPIKIRQEKIPGKRGARWIATFSPDLVGIAAEGWPRTRAIRMPEPGRGIRPRRSRSKW